MAQKRFLKRVWGSERGMTLIEIMVVMAIIGLIGAVVVVNVMDRFEQAKVNTAKTQIKSLENALDQYRLDNGSYPSTEQGLQALAEKPSTGKIPTRYPEKGYLKKIPKDPWGNEYVYYSPGLSGHDTEIISYGADGQEGGEENDADIKSWEIGD